MANSTVTFTNIDEEYPVAGQDNDSQGFRDNFSTIKSGLQNASTELTTLLTNSARRDESNDFNSNELANATTKTFAEVSYNTPQLVSDTIINWTDGAVQNVTISGNVILTLGGWPATGKYGKLKMIIRGGDGQEITWQAPGTGTIKVTAQNWPQQNGANVSTTVLGVNQTTQPIVIEAWTTDGGQNIHLDYIGEYGVL